MNCDLFIKGFCKLAVDSKSGKLFPANNETSIHYFTCDLVIFRPRDKPAPENSMKLVNQSCIFDPYYNPFIGYGAYLMEEVSEYED